MKHLASLKEIYKNDQKSKKINKILKMEKFNRGKEKKLQQ